MLTTLQGSTKNISSYFSPPPFLDKDIKYKGFLYLNTWHIYIEVWNIFSKVKPSNFQVLMPAASEGVTESLVENFSFKKQSYHLFRIY